MGLLSFFSKKKRLVEKFKKILSATYAKIQIIDSLTFDPIGHSLKTKQEIYSSLRQTVVPLLEDWMGEDQLAPKELKELESWLAEKDNPILRELRSMSLFLRGEHTLEPRSRRTLDQAAGSDIRDLAVLLQDLEKTIGALRVIQLEEKVQEQPKKQLPQKKKKNAVPDPENWIVLKGAKWGDHSYPDLLVSIKKGYDGLSFEQTRKRLQHKGCFMLSIRQFFDFILLLESGVVYNAKGERLNKRAIAEILDEIMTAGPQRGEWLNAEFKRIRNILYINEEELLECIMDNGYISLDDLNEQGMPIRKYIQTQIRYVAPQDNSVARFIADSDGAAFCCNVSAAYGGKEFGVRPASFK
ncbi:hypothetical protein HZB00_03740 [Candidatus Woesearchaeota archaeon]|nr:hypothetical protein [Candidatus Woesearchaeota archaeon]